jgi:NADH-quinone oxidoreductase subunit E
MAAQATPVSESAAAAEPAHERDMQSEAGTAVEEPAAEDVGTRPERLETARGGTPDDLKRIKGIGPKLEALCHRLGFFHFDQIANWTDDEIAWVDANLESFKGRVTRDDWVAQARALMDEDRG